MTEHYLMNQAKVDDWYGMHRRTYYAKFAQNGDHVWNRLAEAAKAEKKQVPPSD